VSSLATPASTPAVRKPAFEVTFGGSESDWATVVESIAVDAGLAPAVATAEVIYAARDDAPKPVLEIDGEVALGFDGESPTPVFWGWVQLVQRGIAGKRRIVATTGSGVFAAFRLDQGYEQQTAGAIVRDLAQRAGMDGAWADDGPELPYYVVDSRASAWEHVTRLAALAGFAAWSDADGYVNFKPLRAGAPVQTFTYGQDILELEAFQSPPSVGAVTVVGDGAAGSNGSDAWSWNLKDVAPMKATAGSGDPPVLVQLGAIRSAEAASAAAEGIAANAKLGGTSARLLVPGAPKAAVGTTIAVASAPDDALNGSWLVCGVRHRLVKARGYTTQLLLAKAET
jgi:phage protein D